MNTILDENNKSKEELEALEVAEESRETEWSEPSFVADLFMGKFNPDVLYPYPLQDETDRKEGEEYISRLDQFLSENLDGDEVDRTGEIPEKVMKGMADLGAFALKIPKEYGGMELSQINYVKTLAMVAKHCGSTLALLSAHQSIGVPQPLKLFGTKKQKETFLPRFAKGEISAFALTEPGVGSDPARMKTTATPTEDGNHYLINGEKLWCTNGVIADVIVVMAQTPPKIVRGREKKQITAFIVETNTPGFEVLHRCRFMGLNGVQNGLLRFHNVKVPRENIILGEGDGLRLALTTLNAGRLGLPAAGVGGLKMGLRIAREWGNERVQWGAPIGRHQAGTQKIATIAADLFAMESILWASSLWVDRKVRDIRIEAAIAKVYCSIRSHLAAEDLLQLRGGRGYERYSSLQARGERPEPLERMVRDSRINQIIEGTSEVLRLFIARECLDRHLTVAGDVLNPRNSIGKRMVGGLKAAVFYLTWYPRQWIAWGMWPKYFSYGKLATHLRFVDRSSRRLARVSFHLMVRHGPALQKKQLQLTRLVEIVSELFAISATVGRARTLKENGKGEENILELADLFCQTARKRILAHFKAIRCNDDQKIDAIGNQVLDGKLLWEETKYYT